MRFEADEVSLVGGIRHGRTLGSPVAIEIGNTEWPKWESEMSPSPGLPTKVLTQPRPGHADLPGCTSTGSTTPGTCWSGPRPGRPPPGWRRHLAKPLLWQIGIDVLSHIVQLGPGAAERPSCPGGGSHPVDESQVRCLIPTPRPG